jgi:hypothetical protein
MLSTSISSVPLDALQLIHRYDLMLTNSARLPKLHRALLITSALAGLCIANGTVVLGASTPTLDFSELPFQAADGLSLAGVAFDFKINGSDSSEAFYHSFGPGTLTYVDDPSLTGDSAGVLTLDFAIPTSVLGFGLAINTASALSPGFRVELFSTGLTSLGETPVDVLPTAGALGFAENRFEYAGLPISRAVIRFNHQPGSFALDNLTFLLVPEPSTLMLTSLTLFAIVIRGRRIEGGQFQEMPSRSPVRVSSDGVGAA